MYLPKHFAEHQPQSLHGLIRAHPLGTLITLGSDGEPVADLIPFWLDAPHPPAGASGLTSESALPGASAASTPSAAPPVRLLAHVARSNPLWRTHPAGRPVLVVFHGPDAYISPNWYPTKAEHGKAVPTWNYATVQAKGTLKVIDQNPDWLRTFLTRLTAEHEATQPHPWQLGDAPSDYIQAMLQAVVGLEVEVTQLTGKFKLSQNQPPANQQGVQQALAASLTPRARDTLRWTPNS